jgi:hypothetical protein
MTYSSTILADNPQVYYRLDETSGIIAHDSSGNTYHGILDGSGITYSQNGAIIGDSDTALLFTAFGAVTFPSTLNIATWNALSLEYWINLTSGYQYIVITTDGTTTLKYLNGVLYTSGSGDVVVVDSDVTYSGSVASGDLDEIGLYNYVLSPAQISRHYYQRMSSGAFTVFANSASGTATFDSYRGTQFPDPALSLAPILPRVGQTVFAYDAIIPNNTTLGMDTSLDGVNWTDQTTQNGQNISGIYSQTNPTVDQFSSNTSSNYSSTFETGGSAATVTFDTTNSRLILTSGSNALFLNSSIIDDDIDFFIDMDTSDNGGMVWRCVDQNNFYFITINDTLSSTGNKNVATLFKIVANITTQLATAPLTYTLSSGISALHVFFTRGTYRRFRVTMLFGVITFYMDGIQLFTYTDGSPLSSGQIGLFNNGGTVGSRYYQLWITQLGDQVTGTPLGDTVTGKFVYTRQRLATTDPTVSPQVEDITTLAFNPQIQNGVLIPNKTYTAAFIGKAIDDLAKQSNFSWFIDVNQYLNFRTAIANPAPWILQSNSAGLVVANDLDVDSTLELDVHNDLYRNRQIILGAQNSGTFTDTFVGNGSATSFTLRYIVGTLPVIARNGIAQTVGLKGQTGFQFYYALSDAVIAQDTTGNFGTVLLATDTLLVTYTGLFDTVVQVDNAAAQSLQAAIEVGTTGIVEDVQDHSGDVPKMTLAQAQTLATQLLARYCINGRQFIFNTTRDGLDIGQTLSIFLPEHGINDGQFEILGIEIYLKKKEADTQTYTYKVTCSELPKSASWAKLLASGLLF